MEETRTYEKIIEIVVNVQTNTFIWKSAIFEKFRKK
jgi:hypothetical protein